MSEILTPGIAVGEGPAPSQPITDAAMHATAFVGRALRGPVDTPVFVDSFEAYSRIFGGLWAASPMSHAVRLFFLNGGARAAIVRVARGGRAATISLPAQDGSLTLRALAPGRHEALRAAVDYDQIDPASDQHFNLTVQRTRRFGSEHVIDQEIYTRVSSRPDDEAFVGRALARSTMVELDQTIPASRPRPTLRNNDAGTVHFVEANLDGSDGERPRDVDLLGSGGSGLLALGSVVDFGQLYLAPPAEDADVGVAVLRAAARLCDKQRAILIVDAPRAWRSPSDALHNMKRFSLRSINASMYYPWIWVDDPATGKPICLPPGGAVAGFLARTVLESGIDAAPAGNGAILRGVRRLAQRVEERDSYMLAREGINALRTGRGGRKLVWDARTLSDTARHAPHWQSLRVRRMMLYLQKSIEQGTRWAAFEPSAAPLWSKMTEQVEGFLQRGFEAGIFRGSTAQTAYFVKCDRDINPLALRRAGKVSMRIGFAPVTAGRFVSFEITQSTVPLVE